MSSNRRNNSISDEAKALELAMLLNDIRETANLRQLRYARRVMTGLKRMPKLKPPIEPLKLTEIAPELPREESPQFQPETGSPPPSWFQKLKRRFRRGRGRWG